MSKFYFVFAFLITALSAFAQDRAIFDLQSSRSNNSGIANIKYWAQHFLGAPYGNSGPLGEGRSGLFDQDPLYRFDTFDCTTFVETVLALALTNNEASFKSTINLLRYKNGVVSYASRNHITSQSWIPENMANGFFTDATQSYPLYLQKRAQALIDYPNWLRQHKLNSIKVPGADLATKRSLLSKLRALSSRFTPELVEIDYLSIPRVLEDWDIFVEETHGMYVLNIVRPNWNLRDAIGTNLHISHLGFLFVEGGEPVFYHASAAGMVMKTPLKTYLEKYREHDTVKGIKLLKL